MRSSHDVRLTSKRRPAVAAALMMAVVAPLLSACGSGGFQPLYGSSGIGAHAQEKLAQVDITPIPGRVGQVVRNELIFQTTGGGTPPPPGYKLDIAIRETVASTLVRTDGHSRGQIYNLEASFRLIRLSDSQVALSGTSYASAGFERFTSIFANVRAREDAENRAARTVAVDLKARLSAFLGGAA